MFNDKCSVTIVHNVCILILPPPSPAHQREEKKQPKQTNKNPKNQSPLKKKPTIYKNTFFYVKKALQLWETYMYIYL